MSKPTILNRRALPAALIVIALASSPLAGCGQRALRATPPTSASTATDQADQIDTLLSGLADRMDQTDTMPDVIN